MDEHKIGECVDVEKHVTATNLAEFAMARWFGIKILNLVIALENFKCIFLHYGDDRHGSATNIRAVCAKTVMNLKGRLAVFKADRIVGTAAPARDRKSVV